MSEKKSVVEEEMPCLEELWTMEDIAEKKAKIYSRLLTDVALAKEMEELSKRHEMRREKLCALMKRKMAKKQNEQGRYEMNEEKAEK